MEIERKSWELPDFNPSPGLLTGLSMVGGLGIVLVVVALALGAAAGDNADANAVGIATVLGLLLLLTAIGGWVITVQPHRRFDDINVPVEAEPHHHDEHSHAEEHATDEHQTAHPAH